MTELDIVQDTNVATTLDTSNSVIVALDDEVTIIQTLEQGPPGVPGVPGDKGAKGDPGPPGNTMHYGLTDPTSTIGIDGDSYINTATHFLFGPKAGGAWPAGVSMVGPQGTPGNTVLYGASDPTTIGIDGNFYINTTTHFMFGPKAAGAWPAGTSLIGPQGPQGVQGPQGTPGAGAPSTTPPLMDGAATVGTSLLFSREDHVHPSDANARAVRFDAAQSLTAAQQLQARQNIYAAPFDALAYSGMQVNGATDVSQEVGNTGGTLVATGTNYRPCDGWVVWAGQAVGAVSINVGHVSLGAVLPGFGNGIVVNVNNSNFTNATSGDYLFYQHGIEGYRISRLGWGAAGAMPLSYGFWFAAPVAGVIHVRLCNSAQDRHYYQEHTVVSGWQWLTATIPGDTAGTWLKDNNAGCYISINVAGKETTPVTPGAWIGGAVKRQTTNSTNLMGATNNQTYVTGLIVLPGSDVPPAARSPYIMRPYDQEILTCMRYWEKGTQELIYMQFPAGGIPIAYGTLRFAVLKRATPTVTPTNFQYWQGGTNTAFAPSITNVDTIKFSFQGTTFTNWMGWLGGGTWTADTRI
jgi:hypothetical protein